jgi:serine/threonine protein kinase
MALPGSQAPTRLGRYELLARLATGGMGEIFLARLEGAAGFEKLFVVKRILPHLADDARFRQMLIAEARLASKLSHANICQVYELGETAGQLYIVMEYLEGITLLPLLRKASKEAAPLDLGFIAGVLQQTADALHFAHELRERSGDSLGIVHRDVTPSNIFLTDAGVAKVLDFGIAKVKDASANTQTGTVKGKYAYMAPEQLRGASIDRRVDVFALGVVTFEMLALRRLFQRKTDYLTFRAVMEQPIADVRRYRPDIPEPVAEVLNRALDREPDRRFETVRQFGTAMTDVISTIQRPWTQGEIGDYVLRNFSAEIGKRSAQVASAIHRTDAGQRATMPLIAHDDSQTQIDDMEDEEFPAVDTTLSELPPAVRLHATAPAPERDFAGQTPPPFGVETSSSGHSLQPLDRLIPGITHLSATPPKRSLVWPLLAFAMVCIAGGALFLVWQQTQQRPPNVPPLIIDRSQPEVVNAATPPDPPPGPTQIPVADAADTLNTTIRPPPDKPPPPPPPPPKLGDVIQAVINSQGAKARAKCQAQILDFVKTRSSYEVKVRIQVSKDGTPKLVVFEPNELDSKTVGTCLRNVFLAARFPKLDEPKNLTFPINLNQIVARP